MTGLSSQVGGSALTFDTTNKTIMYTASSERYKNDIKDINLTYSVDDIVKSLRPVSFKWNKDGVQDFGLIAEEVELVTKDLVCYNENGLPESVSYHKLPTLLLSYIQKLTFNLDSVQNKIINLEGILK
jgi:hypothetical protein